MRPFKKLDDLALQVQLARREAATLRLDGDLLVKTVGRTVAGLPWRSTEPITGASRTLLGKGYCGAREAAVKKAKLKS